MKIKILWLIPALLFILAHDAESKLSVEEYLSLSASSKPADKESLELYINGVYTGFSYYAVLSSAHGSKMLFCPPNITLYFENLNSIILQKVEEAKKRKTYKGDGGSVEAVLLFGLQEAFPCK